MKAMLNQPNIIGQPGQKITLDKNTPVHFIGVGGIGMSGLARILVDAGYQVSGSDKNLSAYTQYLTDHGAALFEGHQSGQVPDGAIVVASTAIDENNPEIQQAQQLNLPIVHRSDILREILHHPNFKHQTVIGISGTHGKTSTTGMTAVALEAAGLSPTAIAGGIIPEFNTNAKSGQSGIAVAELDESDGTLIQYQPNIAVMLNLELDHAEHFPGGFDDFVAMFRQFLTHLPADESHQTKVWLNANCAESIKLFQSIKSSINWTPIFFSEGQTTPLLSLEQYESYALKQVKLSDSGCYEGEVLHNGKPLISLAMGTPGRHQLTNGLVALSIVHQLDGDLTKAKTALNNFKGMKRRFEMLGQYNGATLVDDYAHHPTEVAAILNATRGMMQATQNAGRLIAIFQPHRYTRLKTFWQEFQTSFGDADEIIVTEVFEASELPLEGINSALFTEELKQQPSLKDKKITYFSGRDFQPLKQQLKQNSKTGDWVITLGAGDVTTILRGWH